MASDECRAWPAKRGAMDCEWAAQALRVLRIACCVKNWETPACHLTQPAIRTR